MIDRFLFIEMSFHCEQKHVDDSILLAMWEENSQKHRDYLKTGI